MGAGRGGAGGRNIIGRCSRPCLFHEIVEITAGKGKFRIVELTQDRQAADPAQRCVFQALHVIYELRSKSKGHRFALLVLLFIIIIDIHIVPG